MNRNRLPLATRARLFLAAVLGRYEGATFSTSRSYIPASVQSARFDASAATRLELVRKARYFEKNSAIVNRLADLFECYTVGSGLQVNPASSDPAWNQKAKAWFDSWSRFPDVASRQTFPQLQSLLARSWFIDGEVFLLLTRSQQTNRPRVQLIETHLCQTPPDLVDLEGQSIVDGVAIDAAGRPSGYYIATEGPKGSKIFPPAKPADFVVQVWEPGRPGQYRGLPFLYPVLNDLHDLDDLQSLEMKAAKDAAEITNVLKNAAGELSDEELMRAGGTVTNQTLSGSSVTENRAEYVRASIGGRTVALTTGEELEQFKNERPSAATTGYWQLLTEKVCAGVGIPYVLVFPDSMQGTVYRGALDMANAYFRARSAVIAEASRRVYEYVIGWARDNDRDLGRGPADWAAVNIHPPRAVNVDVGRNSSAMLAELKSGARTFADIWGEVGCDWRQKLTQKAEEVAFLYQLAKDRGLDPGKVSDLLAAVPGATPAPGADPTLLEELLDPGPTRNPNPPPPAK